MNELEISCRQQLSYTIDEGKTMQTGNGQFARNVRFQVKQGKEQELGTLFQNDVLPLLRQQKGFRDEVMLVDDGSHRAIGISLWDDRQSAENYRTTAYPKVLETLSPVIDGSPTVEMFDVAATTLTR